MSDQIDKTEKSQNGKQQAERESYSKNRDAHYQRNERTAAQNTGSQQEKKRIPSLTSLLQTEALRADRAK